MQYDIMNLIKIEINMNSFNDIHSYRIAAILKGKSFGHLYGITEVLYLLKCGPNSLLCNLLQNILPLSHTFILSYLFILYSLFLPCFFLLLLIPFLSFHLFIICCSLPQLIFTFPPLFIHYI